MTHDRESAEAFLRQHAVVLAVGSVESFTEIALPHPKDPNQKYLLAVLEVE